MHVSVTADHALRVRVGSLRRDCSEASTPDARPAWTCQAAPAPKDDGARALHARGILTRDPSVSHLAPLRVDGARLGRRDRGRRQVQAELVRRDRLKFRPTLGGGRRARPLCNFLAVGEVRDLPARCKPDRLLVALLSRQEVDDPLDEGRRVDVLPDGWNVDAVVRLSAVAFRQVRGRVCRRGRASSADPARLPSSFSPCCQKVCNGLTRIGVQDPQLSASHVRET